jgi:hypothetical protein
MFSLRFAAAPTSRVARQSFASATLSSFKNKPFSSNASNDPYDEQLVSGVSPLSVTNVTSFTPSAASLDPSRPPVATWIQPGDEKLDLDKLVAYNHRQLEENRWEIPDYTIDERAALLMEAKPLVETSATLEEAHRKSRHFYRIILRKMPALLQVSW